MRSATRSATRGSPGRWYGINATWPTFITKYGVMGGTMSSTVQTPASVQAWQARFGRYAGWQVGVGETATIDRLAEFLKGAAGRAGTHTAQVFVFDRQARLSDRSGDLPASTDIEALLAQLARQA